MYVPPQALRCECSTCEEGICSIDLTGRLKRIHVIDLNCLKRVIRRAGNIADCAILWKNKGIFAIVELKGGDNLVIDRLVNQIQGGVDMIDVLSEDQHIEDFYPILMYKGKDPTPALRGKLVICRGIKRRVIPMECGSFLSDIHGL